MAGDGESYSHTCIPPFISTATLQQWYDYKLIWEPEKFDNIKKLHIPSDQIWIPDILL